MDAQALVSETVRVLMAFRRMHQADLAEYLDVTQGSISRKLNNRTAWQVDELERMQELFGVRFIADLAGELSRVVTHRMAAAAGADEEFVNRRERTPQQAADLGGCVVWLPSRPARRTAVAA